MGGLLRKLLIYICKPIYGLIPKTYSIFYQLSTLELFEGSNVIQQLSANIYVLVSVVMLFAFSVTILSAIVNPDLLSDSKKGVTAAFKRAIIGLLLMVIVPYGFDLAYEVQSNILSNSLIEKIIIGANFSCDESDEDCENGSNGGQVIAGTLISAVLYPNSTNGETVEITDVVDDDIAEAYASMITTDIDAIAAIAENINVTKDGSGGSDGKALKWSSDDDSYAFHFDGLVAIVAGIAVIYILLIYSIDMAVRVFKLAFLELTAPISIVAYMAAGNKVLNSWFSEVLKTFVDVFIRVAAMAFFLFLLSNLSDIMQNLEEKSWGLFLKVLLIVGMLIFIKQLPDMINKLFGTNISAKGGIGGRLGQMAAVGNIAKKGWDTVAKAATTVGLGGAALLGTAGLGSGAVLAAGGAALGAGVLHHGWKKGFGKNGTPLKDTKAGHTFRKLGAITKATGSALSTGNPLKSVSAFNDSYGKSDFGAENKYKKKVKENAEFNEKMGFDEYGQTNDAYGEKNGSNGKFAKNVTKDLDKNRATAVTNLKDANLEKAAIDKISSNKDAIVSELQAAIASASDSEKQQLRQMLGEFNAGNMSSDEMRMQMKIAVENGSLTKSSAEYMSGKLDGIENIIQSNINDDPNNQFKGLFEEKEIEIEGDNGEKKKVKVQKLKIGSNLSDASDAISNRAAEVKSTYDQLYQGSSDDVKKTMDQYVSASNTINKRAVSEQGKGIIIADKSKVSDHKAEVSAFEEAVQSHSSPGSYSASLGSSGGLGANINPGNDYSNSFVNEQQVSSGSKTGMRLKDDNNNGSSNS